MIRCLNKVLSQVGEVAAYALATFGSEMETSEIAVLLGGHHSTAMYVDEFDRRCGLRVESHGSRIDVRSGLAEGLD